MSETKQSGGCHCGAVRYDVALDLDQPVSTCNCSICRKTGTMLAFVPATAFELSQGDDALTDYRFNTKQIAHLFCRTCGVKSFGRGAMPDGTEMIAINVRCLDDVDLDRLQIRPVDGKNA